MFARGFAQRREIALVDVDGVREETGMDLAGERPAQST
jgi:hypothetical protein